MQGREILKGRLNFCTVLHFRKCCFRIQTCFLVSFLLQIAFPEGLGACNGKQSFGQSSSSDNLIQCCVTCVGHTPD